MTQKAETLVRLQAPRAPKKCVFRAVDTEDYTAALRRVQAARLLQRFRFSEAVAQAIAELAFSTGRAHQ